MSTKDDRAASDRSDHDADKSQTRKGASGQGAASVLEWLSKRRAVDMALRPIDPPDEDGTSGPTGR